MKGRYSIFLALCHGAFLFAPSIFAAPPTVSFVSPRLPESSINRGDTVYLRADAQDSDGQISRVEFYVNTTNLVGVSLAPPFTAWWTNRVEPGTDNFFLTAVAVDDALERATSAVVRVWAYPFGPRTLDWAPPSGSMGDWNMRDFNWRSASLYTHFRPYDTVRFNSSPMRVFIGADGVPAPVAPAGRVTIPSGTFTGGDILTGTLEITRAVFTNYAGSLSFPGGTHVAGGGSLTYNIAQAPPGAVVHFGTGPVNLSGGSTLDFNLMPNQMATLENDIGFVDGATQCTLRMGAFNASNAVARFTGVLHLSTPLRVEIHNGNNYFSPEGIRDADNHEWAGPIILSQRQPAFQPGLFLWGSYRSKGLLLSGSIRDGLGTMTNRLTLQTYAVPVIRLSGANTYAHGTLIDYSPSAPQSWVEVAPESSLGRGNVEVRGALHLTGNQNINSNATVTMAGGRIIIDSGVKVRISRLHISPGTLPTTVGLFTQTNAPNWFRSNGTLRLPAVNLPPSIAITNPSNGAMLAAADPLVIRALASDLDSYIERVEFYLNGSLAGVRTNPPYTLSLSSAPLGDATLHAVIFDDDGASTTSVPVQVRIAPRLDSIRAVDTNLVAIQFRTLPEHSLALESSDSLVNPDWTNLATFSGSSITATQIVTNAVPENVPSRYYRLRTQ